MSEQERDEVFLDEWSEGMGSLRTPPIVRLTDPETSHTAAVKITLGGGRRTQAERILAEIREHPGLVVDEIATNIGLDTMKVRKRTSDLKNLGLVYQSGTRAGVDGYQQGLVFLQPACLRHKGLSDQLNDLHGSVTCSVRQKYPLKKK